MRRCSSRRPSTHYYVQTVQPSQCHSDADRAVVGDDVSFDVVRCANDRDHGYDHVRVGMYDGCVVKCDGCVVRYGDCEVKCDDYEARYDDCAAKCADYGAMCGDCGAMYADCEARCGDWGVDCDCDRATVCVACADGVAAEMAAVAMAVAADLVD